jgi:hypothetical protein
MRSLPAHKRPALRVLAAAALLATLIGTSGCYAPDPNGEGGPPQAFCGILYSCGNHGGSDHDDPPPAQDTSGSSSAATGQTGDDSTTTTTGD